MDHIREGHNVPGEIRKVSLEMLFPPWTVTRQLYAESLTAQHFRHFERYTTVQRGGIFASSSLSRAQSGPASCYVSWEVFGAAACSPTGRQRVGHPALPVLLCRPRQAGRMVSVLRLGHMDVAGGKERSWIRLHRSRLGLRSRTRGWRQGPWCLIVVRHC